MIINANTKIAAILKQEPAALEAIISISPRFEKLRNPLLRRLMAGRTSIAMAGNVGNCGVQAFFEKLQPLGFEVDENMAAPPAPGQVPAWFPGADVTVINLDVRPISAAGDDPLAIIMKVVKALVPGQALKVINTFEPAPLIRLLKQQGYAATVTVISDNEVETLFYKHAETPHTEAGPIAPAGDWDALMQAFESRLRVLDVRGLAMPKPMLAILEALDALPADMALFVYHKRVPVYLLPEIRQRKFDYRVKIMRAGAVHLLIFRN
ncbi:hypothetical protein DCC81_23780 [Chitinophaga parva]|uniref:DUF2249 domain-containing protein n=1 Tax=Chitinophaga parva TaxID=2169414 RepID=A0A2T7BEA0_9BACT|nr:DUF2249 domain-containing protein [Chitinophaga parva]PUZ23402.1 hypothetical protein DCC81_23780 [Chitinophaga parva]